MKVHKKKCTESTTGTIVDIKIRGLDFPTIITVQYTVAGQSYLVRESIKLKSEVIKLGPIPIGQRKINKLPDTSIGAQVIVMYNSNAPQEAYLRDNIGWVNV